jgi:hypothetical protein
VIEAACRYRRRVAWALTRSTAPLGLLLSAIALPAAIAGAPAAAWAAGRCPIAAAAGAGAAEIDGRRRVVWIDARLTRAAHRARVWTWGWGAGILVATAANLTPLPYVAPEDRIDWYTGAATTIVGIVPLLIAPLDVVEDSRALHPGVAAMPAAGAGDDGSDDGGEGDDDAGVCRLVADAEARLVRDAKNQADGQRWWLHAGNVALNFGVGLFLGLGFHHWGAGALNAVSGSLIGEAIILSQPTDSIDDLRRYRAGALDEDGPPSAAKTPRLAWSAQF